MEKRGRERVYRADPAIADRALALSGAEFDFPPTMMSWGARHSYLTDPDGHTISFVQSAA